MTKVNHLKLSCVDAATHRISSMQLHCSCCADIDDFCSEEDEGTDIAENEHSKSLHDDSLV